MELPYPCQERILRSVIQRPFSSQGNQLNLYFCTAHLDLRHSVGKTKDELGAQKPMRKENLKMSKAKRPVVRLF
jgi:hypothetical protein